ncbi:accessory Sec system S-layer assembly protein [Peribacillus alkalitolerans]|uniref:accessory Sec system S-layer assembly protein n=1 Tax=Peribacillus alkalitolerans TaxID=1550385 RepID=UPI0013D5F154|nr:accessory Sec system S-layer assembly protein [Peribacillus alkalitolerans]
MGLFRRKKKVTEDQVAVAVEEVKAVDPEFVETTLSFHEEWEVEPQERFVFQYHHQKLSKLKPNQISISGIRLINYDDGFVVEAFLRNTLEKAIQFEAVNLLLLDSEGKPFAKREFDLISVGQMPPLSCRPWRFLFSKEDRLSDFTPQGEDDWKIAFELQKSKSSRHELDLAATWENQITEAQKEQLKTLVNNLPPLKPGEVNFVGIETSFVQDDALAVTVLIRNGSPKSIRLEQIPLTITDAAGEVVCSGGFKLEDFEVKANTSKPWTFIFPSALVMKKDPDLSSWKVQLPQATE